MLRPICAVLLFLPALAGALRGATTELQVTAMSVDLRPATPAGSAATTFFSSYSSARQPRVEVAGEVRRVSGELRPRAGAPGQYETDFLVVPGVTPSEYGSLVLAMPADHNGNGLPDFLELSRSVTIETSGTASWDLPSPGTGTVSARFTRGAGSHAGTYLFALARDGATVELTAPFVLVASVPAGSQAVYTRGATNTLAFTFQMTDETGSPGPVSYGRTTFTVDNADSVTVAAFTFTDSYGFEYSVAATTLQRNGNRFAGSTLLGDGSPDTSWPDYRQWHVEITDPHDADGDGIPDLSDTLPTVAPAITTQPASIAAAAGTDAQFTVVAAGGALAYQWTFNGAPIPRADGPTLLLTNVQAADAGQYQVIVSNHAGSLTSTTANLTVSGGGGGGGSGGGGGGGGGGGSGGSDDDSGWVGRGGGGSSGGGGGGGLPPATAQLINLSVRSRTGTQDNPLIIGWAVREAAELLVRAVGPGLKEFNVTGASEDPRLTLFEGTRPIATNTAWPSSDGAITSAIRQVGAFPLAPGSRDAALREHFGGGNFTAHVTAPTPAVALAEIYRVPGEHGRLVNLSTRSFAGSGDETLITGFVVAGAGEVRLLFRGIGPGLTQYNVPNVLADPVLDLYREETQVQTNNDWNSADAAAMQSVGAFALDPGSKDAAIVATLGAGRYTVHVRGAAGASGTALIEVYVLP